MWAVRRGAASQWINAGGEARVLTRLALMTRCSGGARVVRRGDEDAVALPTAWGWKLLGPIASDGYEGGVGGGGGHEATGRGIRLVNAIPISDGCGEQIDEVHNRRWGTTID